MIKIKINSKEYHETGFYINAVIENESGTRSGLEYVELPANATNKEIEKALANLYK